MPQTYVAFTDFHIVPDGLITPAQDSSGNIVGYYASGTDNAVEINKYAARCRQTGETFVLPPGKYRAASAALDLSDINVSAYDATLLVPNQASIAKMVLFSTQEADIEQIPLQQVQSWTGWERRSQKLGNLKNRAGQYIAVYAPDQTLLRRKSSTANQDIKFAEGFLVEDNVGTLAHMLFGNANQSTWGSGEVSGYGTPYYLAHKLRTPVSVGGLVVQVYRVVGASGLDAAVSVTRSLTNFSDVIVENISGNLVRQLWQVDRCCLVDWTRCHAWGAGETTPAYGWNLGTVAGVTLSRCTGRGNRRDVDSHRGKHIRLHECNLPNGLGAHYAAWMGASECDIGGAGASDNGQLFQICGGGFYLDRCKLFTGPTCSAIVRARDDAYELFDGVAVDDCEIVIGPGSGGTAAFAVFDLTGPVGGFDFGRAIEMPSRVSFQNNNVRDYATTQRGINLLDYCQNWTAAQFPRDIFINTAVFIGQNAWTRENFTTWDLGSTASPYFRIWYDKPNTAKGAGIRAVVSDFPRIFTQAFCQLTPPTTVARMDIRYVRVGAVLFRYGTGAYKTVRAFETDEFASGALEGSVSAPLGDETIQGGPIVGSSPGVKVGFYGGIGSGRQTVEPAATDLASALELVNDLRAKLRALNLLN